jgi:hypothetical protein
MPPASPEELLRDGPTHAVPRARLIPDCPPARHSRTGGKRSVATPTTKSSPTAPPAPLFNHHSATPRAPAVHFAGVASHSEWGEELPRIHAKDESPKHRPTNRLRDSGFPRPVAFLLGDHTPPRRQRPQCATLSQTAAQTTSAPQNQSRLNAPIPHAPTPPSVEFFLIRPRPPTPTPQLPTPDLPISRPPTPNLPISPLLSHQCPVPSPQCLPPRLPTRLGPRSVPTCLGSRSEPPPTGVQSSQGSSAPAEHNLCGRSSIG